MTENKERTIEDKLAFQYDPAPQRSPEWLARKRGKIGGSRLDDWMNTSKAKATLGKPLKPRLDYEKELMFERQFDVSFSTFVNDAMQEGIDYEDFAVQQFAKKFNYSVTEVGCWYNDFMVVSPDRIVFPDNVRMDFLGDVGFMKDALGVLEIKIVKDNTFTQILMADVKETHAVVKRDEKGEVVLDAKGKPTMVGTGVPEKHWKQVQSQLKATGLTKGWYVALNFNTKKYVVIEVERDDEFLEYLMESIQENLVLQPFAIDKVHDIEGDIPTDISLGAIIDRSDSNVNQPKPADWAK